jgi:hypothetical protein
MYAHTPASKFFRCVGNHARFRCDCNDSGLDFAAAVRLSPDVDGTDTAAL